MNLVLVQILKHEWPHNWPTFISDLVGSSKTSEVLCENNMNILKLLSEEVFDFSKDQMTTAKIKTLKESLNSEFSQIFQLCDFITDNSQKPSLIIVTLQTLLRFLSWIPLGYVFETGLINKLITRYLPAPVFRNDALWCLTEIGSLGGPTGGGTSASTTAQYDGVITRMYTDFMAQLRAIIPNDADIAMAYDNGTPQQEQFIKALALFFSGFYKAHLSLLEKPELTQELLMGLAYLVRISEVDDDEIFKICLEYWNFLASELYQSETNFRLNPHNRHALNLGPLQPSQYKRKQVYQPILSRVRVVMISRMAKPEEVLIVEDENGEIVREHFRDTDAIALYKTMRETLVYLTHLDYEDTENIMLEKLALQVDGQEWGWNNLNTLCWAIGSISGAMNEEDEKRFLVTVIKDLLGLCELKRGKDNKAVIASNIMYVVGQYPRFLRAHWKFLKTVVNKLFEFMHELHPGVQDMACDTFLKIAQKCRRKFVVLATDERVPFVEELLGSLPTIVSDLATHQVHIFYEAVGCMVSAALSPAHREQLLAQLMSMPNQSWQAVMAAAGQNTDSLMQPETVKEVWKVLKTNVKVCGSVGTGFVSQLSSIYLDMLNVYKWYSEHISTAVAAGGVLATKTSLIRSMRSVKKETLCLIEEFIQKYDDPQTIARNFIPPLLDPVLGDYMRSIPDARDPEVLSLFASAITQLKGAVLPEVPRILEAVFECTLQMITTNFEDFPEHRINFFMLLKAVNTHTFSALFNIPPAHQKLVVDSVVWAFRHTERNIAETGLEILYQLLQNVGSTQFAQGFYQSYLTSLVQDVLVVLTDRLHKSGFKMHATLLKHIFTLVETNQVTAPLFDAATVDPGTTNRTYLQEFVTNLLTQSFANLTSSQVQSFVSGLFNTGLDINQFKLHLRDFLIQLKEFSAEDNTDLFFEENAAMQALKIKEQTERQLAVPGLVNPHDRPEDDMADL